MNVLLKSLAGDSYFKLIYRANIIEKILQLYDKFSTVGKFLAVNLYRKKSVAFEFCLENNMLPACPDCKRAFLAKPETGELFCNKCNRIEVVDGTAFLPEQRRGNKARGYPSKWGFKYYLDHLLGNDFLEKLGSKYDPSRKLLLLKLKQKMIEQNINPKFLTIDKIRQLLRAMKRPELYKYSTLLSRKLSCRNLPTLAYDQRKQVDYLYKRISDYLPKKVSYAFICYKILSSILNFTRPAERNSLVYKTTKTCDTSKN